MKYRIIKRRGKYLVQVRLLFWWWGTLETSYHLDAARSTMEWMQERHQADEVIEEREF